MRVSWEEPSYLPGLPVPWTVQTCVLVTLESFPEEEMFSRLKGSDFAIVVLINPATSRSCLKVLSTHGLSHPLKNLAMDTLCHYLTRCSHHGRDSLPLSPDISLLLQKPEDPSGYSVRYLIYHVI